MKVRIPCHKKAFNVIDKEFCHIEDSTGEKKISNSREKEDNVDSISSFGDNVIP